MHNNESKKYIDKKTREKRRQKEGRTQRSPRQRPCCLAALPQQSLGWGSGGREALRWHLWNGVPLHGWRISLPSRKLLIILQPPEQRSGWLPCGRTSPSFSSLPLQPLNQFQGEGGVGGCQGVRAGGIPHKGFSPFPGDKGCPMWPLAVWAKQTRGLQMAGYLCTPKGPLDDIV